VCAHTSVCVSMCVCVCMCVLECVCMSLFCEYIGLFCRDSRLFDAPRTNIEMLTVVKTLVDGSKTPTVSAAYDTGSCDHAIFSEDRSIKGL